MFKVGDRVIHPKGVFCSLPEGARGEVVETGSGQVRVLFGKGPFTKILYVGHGEIELDPMFGWIEYGKTYGELSADPRINVVGLQVDFKGNPPDYLPGIFLVGDISRSGRSLGERFRDPQIVIRYRRLLTPEQLEE